MFILSLSLVMLKQAYRAKGNNESLYEASLHIIHLHLAVYNILIVRKPVFGARDMVMLKQAYSATETI